MAKKYRPYFTLAELKHLAELSAKESQISPLTKYLQKYVSDIDSGWRAENYSATGRGVADKLANALEDTNSEIVKANVPAFELAQQERYLAGQMSETEEAEYLKSIGAVFG